MKIKHGHEAGKIVCCEGEISVNPGILGVDCSECTGRMELWQPECFIGLSGRMIPGFQGSIVLKGDIHRTYEGVIVETLSTHSRILKEIRGLGGDSNGPSKKLSRLIKRIEKDMISDPNTLIERKNLYLNEIRKTLRDKDPPEAERFLSLIEATTKMIKRLERGFPKGE